MFQPNLLEKGVILDRFRLDDQVAVVTGAGRGLGAAIAVAFAEVGADVLIASRTQAELDSVAAQVESVGRRAHVVVADLAHPEATAELAGAAVEAFGKLDIVVNNVGGSMPNTLMTTTVKEMRDAFSFNVLTAHAPDRGGGTTDAGALRGRQHHQHQFDHGAVGRGGFAAYSTAKAALAQYTRLTALDLCPRIRVNAIAPGSILTSALDIVASTTPCASLWRGQPLRRLGDPLDIAAAAVYLASAAGSFLTGKMLEVDGGLTVPNLDLPIPDL